MNDPRLLRASVGRAGCTAGACLLVLLLAGLLPGAATGDSGDPPAVAPLPPEGVFGPPRPMFAAAPALGDPPARGSGIAPVPLTHYPLPGHGLSRGISDGHTFVLDHAPSAGAAMQVAAGDGAEVVRLPVVWRAVEGQRAPVDPRDPADPAYAFEDIDDAVRSARAAGLDVVLAVLDAPDRHEAPGRWAFARRGTWAPRPEALGLFAEALARRYDGAFADPERPGATLPAVRRFQAWNEPNLPHYLQPQWIVRNGRWHPYAPGRYREMLNAFGRGVHAAQPRAVVATAGTAPLGEQRDGEGRMAPVRFWRVLLCLASKPGDAEPSCPDPPHFDAFAAHPLSIRDPAAPASGGLDVAIADLEKVLALVHEAQRRGRVVPAGGQPLWITELNWDSRPPNRRGANPAQAHRWVAEGLYRLWRMGATLVTWQFLRDPLLLGDGRATHPGGLYRVDATAPGDLSRDRPKPALRAYRLPFVAERTTAQSVRVWALLRDASAPVSIQIRRGGSWQTVARPVVRAGGFVLTRLRRAGALVLRARGADGTTSATWSVGARIRPLR